MKVSLRAKLALSFGLALLVFAILGIASYRSASSEVEGAAWIAHTNRVLADIETIRTDLARTESYSRQAAPGGKEQNRQAYRAASAEIRKTEEHLRTLTREDPAQVRSLDRLDALLAEWASLQQQLVQTSPGPAQQTALREQQADLADRIGSALKEMQDHEQATLEGRAQKSLPGARRTRVFSAATAVLACFLVLGSFFLIDRDVSERERAERTVLREKEFSQALIRSSMDGILAYDPDFHLTLWNPAMESLTGIPQGEILGRRAFDVFPFLLEAGLDRTMAAALDGKSAIATDQPYTIAQTGKSGYFEGTYSPLRGASGEIIGGLGIVRDITGRKRDEETLRRLSAQLLRAQDSERRRLARELHDSLGQRLAALAMNLSWLENSPLSAEGKARNILNESRGLVDETVQEIRTLSYLLHPPLLEELGLSSTVTWYVQGFIERSGIQVELDIPPDLGRLPREVELALFRVVQEGLTNVQRHSGSVSASVRLARENSEIVVEVTDHGRGMPQGFPAEAPQRSRLGVGIAGMQERVRELGGTLDIRSSTSGTRLKASIPSRQEA